MYEDINYTALYAFMGAAALFAIYLLTSGLQALAKRTSQFDIITPVLNSCLNCTGAHVLAPDEVPRGYAIHQLNATMVQCREMMRDELRLTDEAFMEKWDWVYEEKAHEHTAIASKCPQFKLVNKDGSIG